VGPTGLEGLDKAGSSASRGSRPVFRGSLRLDRRAMVVEPGMPVRADGGRRVRDRKRQRMSTRTTVCRVDEMACGDVRRVRLGSRDVVLCRAASGDFYAVGDRCPHQGASLCSGSLGGTTFSSQPGEYQWGSQGEILRCPWHGWEFDIKSGGSVWGDPRIRVATYPVYIEQGFVAVGHRPQRWREVSEGSSPESTSE